MPAPCACRSTERPAVASAARVRSSRRGSIRRTSAAISNSSDDGHFPVLILAVDPGVRTPLVDFFRRGEVARDVRLVAAQGAFAPRALDQLALLILLKDDADPEIAREALDTIERLPPAALAAFLGRPDVPTEMGAFFQARGGGIGDAGEGGDEPLIELVEGAPAEPPEDEGN